MEYINRIELQGVVGCVRTNTIHDMQVQNFSLMTEYVNKLEDGAVRCETTWHNVVAWEKPEVVKGSHVRVVGRLRTARYTAADGTDRVYTEVLATEVVIVND